MLKIYLDSTFLNPIIGEPDHKIIEVVVDCPELEMALYGSRSTNLGEFRRIIDFKRIEEG